jgi:hypothetical protein
MAPGRISAEILGVWRITSSRLTVSQWAKFCPVSGNSEIRTRIFGYRLLYILELGWIYVLHAFKKKTNQTSKSDIDLAEKRLKRVRARKDEPFIKEGEEKESA